MSEKIAVVVQRYGTEINGGAEYHARLVAEHLNRYFPVEVFTSTALDYITWKHHFNTCREDINGISVNRYRVQKERTPKIFGAIQEKVFNDEHSLQDELFWLEEEGPLLSSMLHDLEKREKDFRFMIFFSYRYWHSFYGIKKFSSKSILVPTAEHDPTIYLYIFKELFHLPEAIIYNSKEEKDLINRVSSNFQVLSDIVGIGCEIPEDICPERARQKYQFHFPFIIYIGRLDENKGVLQLCNFFIRYKKETADPLKLVLVGQKFISLPQHPDLIELGFVSEKDKFDLLAASELLIIPSQFESLSMVTLEAWALGKAVIANGKTEVLKGQCQRSNGGLWYSDYEQFLEIMKLVRQNKKIAEQLGKNGRKYFHDNYRWEIIENKFLNIFNEISKKN